jgi:hypothetical protein
LALRLRFIWKTRIVDFSLNSHPHCYAAVREWDN